MIDEDRLTHGASMLDILINCDYDNKRIRWPEAACVRPSRRLMANGSMLMGERIRCAGVRRQPMREYGLICF